MTRRKDCRRVGKEHLALAVRKDFNAAMIHELEAITSFLYTVRNQGELAISTKNGDAKTQTSGNREKLSHAFCSLSDKMNYLWNSCHRLSSLERDIQLLYVLCFHSYIEFRIGVQDTISDLGSDMLWLWYIYLGGITL